MKFTIFLSALVLAATAHAGNENRGTEDSVIIGEYLFDRLDEEGHGYFDLRVKRIAEALENREAISQVANLFRGGNPKFFKIPRGVSNPTEMFLKLKDSGVADGLDGSKIVLSQKCVDNKGEERTAVTGPPAGSDICVNPRRVALLELALSDFYPKNLGDIRVLRGVLAHEGARQFDTDDDHKFLLGMIPQGDESQFVPVGEAAESNLKPGRSFLYAEEYYRIPARSKQGRHLGYDYKKAESFTIRASIAKDAPSLCMTELRVSYTKPAGPIDHYAGGMLFSEGRSKFILSEDKRSGTFSNSANMAKVFKLFPDTKTYNGEDYDKDDIHIWGNWKSALNRNCDGKITIEVLDQNNQRVTSDVMRGGPTCESEGCWSPGYSLHFWNLEKFNP